MRSEDFSNWTFHKECLWEELDFNMYMYMLKEVFQFFIRDLTFNCYLLWLEIIMRSKVYVLQRLYWNILLKDWFET